MLVYVLSFIRHLSESFDAQIMRLFLCIAATIGIVNYTNYEDMKHAVGLNVFSASYFLEWRLSTLS